MARINLLPWRAERRKQRQKEFVAMLGLGAVTAVLISFLIVLYYDGQIDGQKDRNQYLTTQITEVNKQIAEIAELDKKKDRLLKRKEVIEELQSRRSLMVHLFDELARTVADGMQITSIQQNGSELNIRGRAQSNARVSTYMRNLDASGWMAKPDLNVIEAKGNDSGLPYEFELKVTLKNPNATEDAAQNPAASAAPAPAKGGKR